MTRARARPLAQAIKLKPRFCDAYNNLASSHMQLGQTHEAIETYQMALVLNPALVDAHCNLGNLFKAQGQLDEARRSYLEAIRIKPDFAIAWSNLAGVFKDEGQVATAVAYYREAIRLCPRFADAYSNLGSALKEQGALGEAAQCYQTALKLRPDFAIAHGNLASVYYDQGEMERAIRTFRYAIQLEPNFPDAYNNLGNALRETGELDDAIECYRTTLRLKPDHPHAYNNLGNAMKDKGMVKEAIHCYVTAARLMPRFAAAHSNLGSVLKEQGRIDQALAHYHQAIAIDPMFADPYSNMGNAYKDLGQIDNAIKCYTTAIKIRPGFADAYSNLASAYKDGGMLDEAIRCYRQALSLKPEFPDAFANLVHSLLFVCDWRSRAEDMAKLETLLDEQLAREGQLPSVQPFHALVYPINVIDMQRIARRYAERTRANIALLEMPPLRHAQRRPDERVHVAYVSSDLGNHPLSHLMQSVFGMHDARKYKVSCYALTPSDQSAWRRKIEEEVEVFKDVSALSNADVARLIHHDGVHVLVNLNGYTKGARNEIFALRPAPLQAAYMGFCGTLGADYMQYMFADAIVVPPEQRCYYDEKIVSLPHSYFVNDYAQSCGYVLDPAQLPARAQYGIPEDKWVFACFNQIYKIDPSTFDSWMAILKRVPNSVLWLLRFPPVGEANVRREARARGIRDDQIHFTDVASKEEHIKRGYLADLFLDTPQCNAHTTGCDILWGGTPMVTLSGDKMATRVGASLLTAAGCRELVCDTPAQYEELAVKMAVDADYYYKVRQMLEDARQAARLSPLFDTLRWVRNFERGVDEMVRRHEAGEAPDHIDIEDVGAENVDRSSYKPSRISTTSHIAAPVAAPIGQ